MVVRTDDIGAEPCHAGLRMTANEFMALPESHTRYELLDGIVIVSPSPSFWHQRVVSEVLVEISTYLRANAVGVVVADIDVRLGDNLVYRPDLVFLGHEKAARCTDRVEVVPDLVVEVVSPASRGYDARTKHADYEAAGVGEHWLIDPRRREHRFFVRKGDRFVEAAAQAGRYRSTVIPGFELELAAVDRLA